MDTAELKLKIFQQVDSLEPPKLEEVYGLILNFLNSSKEPDEWAFLTSEQKAGIEEAIAEIEQGKGVAHENVVAEFRDKYGKK